MRIRTMLLAMLAGMWMVNCANVEGGMDPALQAKVNVLFKTNIENGKVKVTPLDSTSGIGQQKMEAADLSSVPGELEWSSPRAELEYIDSLIGMGVPYENNGYIEAKEAEVGEVVAINYHTENDKNSNVGLSQKIFYLRDGVSTGSYGDTWSVCMGGKNPLTGHYCTTYSAAASNIYWYTQYTWASPYKYTVTLYQSFDCCGRLSRTGTQYGWPSYHFEWVVQNGGGTYDMDSVNTLVYSVPVAVHYTLSSTQDIY